MSDKPKATTPNAQYYKDRGLVRYTAILSEGVFGKIDVAAKSNDVTKGDVMEVVLNLVDTLDLSALLEERKSTKVDGRKTGVKRELISSLKDLKPEQLAVIQAQIQSMKGSNA